MIPVTRKNMVAGLPLTTGSKYGVSLPCEQPYWNKLCYHIDRLKNLQPMESGKLEEVLRDIQRVTEEDVAQKPLYPPSSAGGEFYFGGLIHFLEHDASIEERSTFFEKIMPKIATLAVEIEQLKPQAVLHYCLQQQDGHTQISRQFAASLLAHSFLCTLPPQTSVDLNQINFRYFFKHLKNLSLQKAQAAKLRCILNYFRRLSEAQPQGNLVITRKVFPPELMPSLDTWESSQVPLCALIIKQEGAVESAGSDVTQVDFANRYIGGGVLSSGLVQEEIRFITCPELIACLTLVECMQDNEAVQISGFERYSDYSGYTHSFTFKGDYQDDVKVDTQGNLESTLLAIDASEFYDTSDDQYRENYLLRDLNKAFVGFLPVPEAEHEESLGDSEDFSFHTVATERSHHTAETDFETASEGPEVPRVDPGCPYDLNHITNYGNALSKAITDIAVKDASIIQSGESLDCSISDDTEELKNLMDYDQSEGMMAAADWSLLTENSYISREMKNFCENLTDEVILSVLSDDIIKQSNLQLVGEVDGSGDFGNIRNSVQALQEEDLKGLVNNLVSSAVTEALHLKNSGSGTSENSCNHSETFLKVGRNGDSNALVLPENGYQSMVEKYVSEVIGQAVSIVRRLDNIEEECPSLSSSDRSNRSRRTKQKGNQVTDSTSHTLDEYFMDPSSYWNDASMRSHLLNNLEVRNAGSASGVAASNGLYPGPDRYNHPLLPRVSPYQGPVVNIQNPDMPSPDRSVDLHGFHDPVHLPIFGQANRHLGDELVDQRNLDNDRMFGNHHQVDIVDTFSDEFDDYVEDEDSELDLMIAAASRRSSNRSDSASSKPPNLDSFTEGLLKIANIDPQGRRPSRTEESLQYFSAELAKRVERDRYNLRRESDLDRFTFDLFHDHGVPQSRGAREGLGMREEVAATCASRLAADIMQDVAIQMFGTVFPHSVRLIPAREGDFPPRREPSEVDLLSLAANLANTILESAMQTYQRDYLGGAPESLPATSSSESEELESDLNSRFAQIDENSVCESTLTEDIVPYKMRIEEEVHYSSVDEMAWNMSSAIISAAYIEVRKVKMLQELFEKSLNVEQRPLATGNWGCGVYGGDPQVKSLIQWMAASQAGIRTVYYYSFDDRRVEQLPEVVQLLRMRSWSVGRTAKFVRDYCQRRLASVGSRSDRDLFGEVLGQKLTT